MEVNEAIAHILNPPYLSVIFDGQRNVKIVVQTEAQIVALETLLNTERLEYDNYISDAEMRKYMDEFARELQTAEMQKAYEATLRARGRFWFVGHVIQALRQNRSPVDANGVRRGYYVITRPDRKEDDDGT